MLIWTQNQSRIVNLDNVEEIYEEAEIACFNPGCNIFARGKSGKSITMGRYKDYARAKEVLEEIANLYWVANEAAYMMPSE